MVMMLFYQRRGFCFFCKSKSRIDFRFLFSWKVAGNIPSIDLRLSDKRLFQIINHIQSIPFPESKNPSIEVQPTEEEVTSGQLLSSPEQTLEAVEGMTPVLKTKEKVEAEENENKESEEKKKEFEGQLTQLEATFTLDKVKILVYVKI
jgi:hypothetical protein